MNEALRFLCNPKMKILAKENMKTPQFQPGEKATVNLDFTNANQRCNFIPIVTNKRKTVGKTEEEVVDDKEIKVERQNIIDATIVRIMKVSPVVNMFVGSQD